MDKQIILACDEEGKFTGEYIPKDVGHTGSGKRHLAIAVLLENSRGGVLLQRRKHKVFDDIWDVTGATHPLHLEDPSSAKVSEDKHDETYEEATERCLKREYGINPQEVSDLRNLGTFNYFASYKDGLCENEHCAMLVGKYDGELNLNPEVGYNYKWMDKQEFLKDIEANPTNYSPWAIPGVQILKEAGYFK